MQNNVSSLSITGHFPLKYILKIGLILWAVIGIVGCTSSSLTPNVVMTATPAQSPQVPKQGPVSVATEDGGDSGLPLRWLQKIPCSLPCWEGITAGASPSAEAIATLRNNALLANIETGPLNLKDLGYITWQWQGTSTTGEAIFDAAVPGAPIQFFRVYFSSSFQLKDVIHSYGEPSHIIVSAGRGPDIGSNISYSVQFIYLNQGLSLHYIAGVGHEKPILTDNLHFRQAEFFAPSEEGLIKGLGLQQDLVDRAMRPWQGFRDFDFYCKQVYGNEPDRCQ